MARTIAEIKQQMADAFMDNSAVQDKYGFAQGAQFDDHFSKVSIENLIFYIVAVAAWTLEKIFDSHKADVEEALEARQPCTARWYHDQILALRSNDVPVCTVCSVSGDGGALLVKIQQGDAGNRRACTITEQDAVRAWLMDNHEAGVRYILESYSPDELKGDVYVYYDARHFNTTGTADSDALNQTLHNIPYNGILDINSLTAALLAVPGIMRVKTANLQTRRYNGPWAPVNVQTTSYSGSWVAHSDLVIHRLPYTDSNL